MNQNTERLMRWIEQQGAVACNYPEERQRLLAYVTPVAATFPDLVNRLSAVYVYRMREQHGEAAGSDGISWRYESNTGTFFAVGISTEAMDDGAAYTQFIFLHELAHIATWEGHDGSFHEELNRMLGIFNRETGSILANDFLEWSSRYDRRMYALSNEAKKL